MMREIKLARGWLRLVVGDPDEGTVGASAVTSSGQVTATLADMTSGGVSTSSRPIKKSRFDQALFIKFLKPVHSEYISLPHLAGTGHPSTRGRQKNLCLAHHLPHPPLNTHSDIRLS
jgi:hypothetical protein